MYWIRDIYGDYINISMAKSIYVETFPDEQSLTDKCTVVVEIDNCYYYLWAEKPASNESKDIDKTIAKAHLFIDAIVQRLNSAE